MVLVLIQKETKDRLSNVYSGISTDKLDFNEVVKIMNAQSCQIILR